MAEVLYAGTTKVIRFNNALYTPADPDAPPSQVVSIGAGESILISIIDSAGTVVVPEQSASNGGTGDDWYVTVTLPPAGRGYRAKVVVVKNGANEVMYSDKFTVQAVL